MKITKMLVRDVVNEIGSRIGLGGNLGCEQGGLNRGIAQLAALLLEDEEIQSTRLSSPVEENRAVVSAENRVPTVNQSFRTYRRRIHRTAAESPNNVSGSPPSVSPVSSSVILQREGAITQPLSTPASPLSSLSSPVTQLNLPSPEDCTQDPNWQATKSTVRERNAAMFNNHLMADIQFIVGSPGHTQCIPAHKYVLATGSSVFYAMFYGGLAENKKDIEVPDVEPAAFLTLLKYMYCDEIQLEADTVLATLYVAKKYIVPYLARACVNYLETSLTAKNACLLLSQSRLFEEPDLMQRCWEVIDAQVSENQRILRSLSFSESGTNTSFEDKVCSNGQYVYRTLSFGAGTNLYPENQFENLQRQCVYKNFRFNDNNYMLLENKFPIAPYSLSLSESDCCPYDNKLDNHKLIFSLNRTRSEPYFPDNRLDIEVIQNITYQDSYEEDYECNENNINLDGCCDNNCDEFSRHT